MRSRSWPGLFVSLEGPEGAGKTTHAARLVEHFRSRGVDVVALREPGGTGLSEQIRALLLDPAHTALALRTEMLLFAAARAQLVAEVIEPALARGALVVCDRYIDSSIAYQGVARGLGAGIVRQVNEAATNGLYPDLTLLLDVDPRLGLGRVIRRHGFADRLERETLAFHERVREGFLMLAGAAPHRIHVVDASEPLDAVYHAVVNAIDGLMLGRHLPASRS